MNKKIVAIGILCIFYFVSIVSVYYIGKESARNFYKPVRILYLEGYVLRNIDDNTKINADAFMQICNYSNREQKVTFVVYQHNVSKQEQFDCFFDIDYIYVNERTDTEEVLEDGIVKVPAGETLSISIETTARDSSKAITSRSGPSVEVVILDDSKYE